MLRFADDLWVYLHRELVDFRFGINTLAALVEESMQLDPLPRAVYAGDISEQLHVAARILAISRCSHRQ